MNCARFTKLLMRAASVIYMLVGIALIVFGCVIQKPPKAWAPALFVTVGSLNLFASLLGLWGSYHKRRILLFFIVFAGLSVAIQIAFDIGLIVSFNGAVNAVVKQDQDPTKYAQVSKQLNIARWVFLGFIFVELMTIILAVLLKWVIADEDNTYKGFDDDVNEQRALNMSNLAKDIEKGKKAGKESAYEKIRVKMQAKYGQVQAAAGDWRAKAPKFSWRSGET